jgi:hypothetical protein
MNESAIRMIRRSKNARSASGSGNRRLRATDRANFSDLPGISQSVFYLAARPDLRHTV